MNWRAAAFEDATEGGTRLTVTTIPSNDQGPRLALFGDQFYFEVAKDRDRSDTLFLTRIEMPRARLACRASSIARCGSGPAGCRQGSTTSIIFSGIRIPRAAAAIEVPAVPQTVLPGPALLGLLSQAPPELRSRFRPTTEARQSAAGRGLPSVAPRNLGAPPTRPCRDAECAGPKRFSGAAFIQRRLSASERQDLLCGREHSGAESTGGASFGAAHGVRTA